MLLEPHLETPIPVYVKKEEIRDTDILVFFIHDSLESLGLDGCSSSFDGNKLYVTIVNRGINSVPIKRGTYLGYILLESENK
jgi:hypothetical protein